MPAPSQPALAAQVQTPAPAMFAAPAPTPPAPVVAEALFQAAPPSLRVEAPPPSVFAEVSQPFLLVAPPIVEAPRPLAQMPPRVVAPPPEPPVFEAPQPAAYVATRRRICAGATARACRGHRRQSKHRSRFEIPSPDFVCLSRNRLRLRRPPAPAPVFETAGAGCRNAPAGRRGRGCVRNTGAGCGECLRRNSRLRRRTRSSRRLWPRRRRRREFETPAPVFEMTGACCRNAPAVLEAVAAFEMPTRRAFETPEPVAEVPPPVVEAVAAFETPEPVAEVSLRAELEAPVVVRGTAAGCGRAAAGACVRTGRARVRHTGDC